MKFLKEIQTKAHLGTYDLRNLHDRKESYLYRCLRSTWDGHSFTFRDRWLRSLIKGPKSVVTYSVRRNVHMRRQDESAISLLGVYTNLHRLVARWRCHYYLPISLPATKLQTIWPCNIQMRPQYIHEAINCNALRVFMGSQSWRSAVELLEPQRI